MPFAREALANYLTDTIRSVVRTEVLDSARSRDKIYSEPRIFEDLLSSQPLCFNLFAELKEDLALASRVFERLFGRPGIRVQEVAFEHSPGRGDPRFTGDHSAFDVFVIYLHQGRRAFVGVEVKYVENLSQAEARHRARYDEVAAAMGVFSPAALGRLRRSPLEQLWRDHLLAASLALDPAAGFEHGGFAVIWPGENQIVGAAVDEYAACLTDKSGFLAWTLEEVLAACEAAGAGAWSKELRTRYLGT
jgi:hypothetical protein